jgi:hypothetical protein
MIRRHIVLSVLYPHFDSLAARFRNLPTKYNLHRLQTVAEAMECAQSRPLSILTKILKDVSPQDYIRVMCKYKG